MRGQNEIGIVGPHSVEMALATARQTWRMAKYYGRATTVRTREEFDAAMARSPRFIVVEGTDLLRAYAASLAYRGGQEAALLEVAPPAPSSPPAYMMVPTVGRIRDGYRQRRDLSMVDGTQGARRRRKQVQPGMGTVAAAAGGLLSALLVEWLSWPAGDPELVRRPHHHATLLRPSDAVPLPTHAPVADALSLGAELVRVMSPLLVAMAVAALLYLGWQAMGGGRAVRVSWRVEHRIQGRLVIARVRTRIA